MKPLRPALLAALLVSCLLGCIPSLNPIYTDKDLVFDEKLLGTWNDPGTPGDSWTFSRDGEKGYRLIIKEGDKNGPFAAHLVKLGENRFLDIVADKSGLDDLPRTDFYKSGLIRAHFFMRVDQIQPILQLAFLKPEWLEKLLATDPKALATQKLEGDTGLITASTPELQAFLLKHARNPEAWTDPSTLRR